MLEFVSFLLYNQKQIINFVTNFWKKKDKGSWNGTYAAFQSTVRQVRSWNTTGIEKDGVIFSTQNDGIFE